MAEDRKPKIDLKSRLQKMGGPTPAPGPVAPTVGGMPAPGYAPAPGGRGGPGLTPVPPPPASGPSRAPMPQHVGPPGMHPGHQLSAMAHAVMPAAQSGRSVNHAQLIEVDEGAVKQARKGAFKGGLVTGMVVGVFLLVLGWFGGNAKSNADAHAKGVADAHDLAADLTKAKDTLGQLAQKLQDGGKSIGTDRKFPVELSQQLAAINVDFGGDKLFGRRFSGVPAATTAQLFDFITRVQTLNDKKDLVIALLNKLQKPITAELARPAGQLPISYVVVVDKGTGDNGAFLAPLATPIVPDDKTPVPNDLTFVNPRGSGNVKLPRLQGEKIPATGAAVTIVPNTFEKVCPSATRGQIAQLISSMNSVTQEINGQKAAPGEDAVTETKAGLGDVAAQLADQLTKVY